jgi:NAD(P)-dependent dehydrogenase (short-subunit alcohol dehydrogenase family)
VEEIGVASSLTNSTGKSAALTVAGAATRSAAQMSQVSLGGESAEDRDESLFPRQMDVNGTQIDLRGKNSWLLTLGEVSTPEVVEVLAVNTVAPTVLNARLKALMVRTRDADAAEGRADAGRYIVNVSAMEGKFYRHKNANHPHTNMAKAALNMMTRTSGADYAKAGIYMNSVDTGWINDENPLLSAARISEENNFQTPIDEIDAASRVLDPLVSGVNGEAKLFGKFLKDYVESEW